mgnify:CR=1 FL=1
MHTYLMPDEVKNSITSILIAPSVTRVLFNEFLKPKEKKNSLNTFDPLFKTLLLVTFITNPVPPHPPFLLHLPPPHAPVSTLLCTVNFFTDLLNILSIIFCVCNSHDDVMVINA